MSSEGRAQQAGSPIIAGGAVAVNGLSDLPDDGIGESRLFDFESSPDTLQSYGSNTSADVKMFISPSQLHSQEPLPDSPNGSAMDSSSESTVSLKRAGSDRSHQTPQEGSDLAMGSDFGNAVDWEDSHFMNHDHNDESYDSFAFANAATSDRVEDVFSFGGHDENFLSSSFEMPAVVDDSLPSGPVTNMASPGMPTIETDSPAKLRAEQQRKRANQNKKSKVSLKQTIDLQ